MNNYQCESIILHEDAIREVQKHLLKENDLSRVSQLFKALSDPTRIKILFALEKHELCVCDIAVILKMTQSAISHQLKTLRQADLVRHRKDGKTVFYKIADEHIHHIFSQALVHVMEAKR